MSENIKTSKQLYPVFICYFIKNINFPIVIILIYLQLPNYIISLTFIYTTMSASILNGIIEYIIITLVKNYFKKFNKQNCYCQRKDFCTLIRVARGRGLAEDEVLAHFPLSVSE